MKRVRSTGSPLLRITRGMATVRPRARIQQVVLLFPRSAIHKSSGESIFFSTRDIPPLAFSRKVSQYRMENRIILSLSSRTKGFKNLTARKKRYINIVRISINIYNFIIVFYATRTVLHRECLRAVCEI